MTAGPGLFLRSRRSGLVLVALVGLGLLACTAKNYILPSADLQEWWPNGNPLLLAVPGAVAIAVAAGTATPMAAIEASATRRRGWELAHVGLLLTPGAALLMLAGSTSRFHAAGEAAVRNTLLLTAVALAWTRFGPARLSWLAVIPWVLVAFLAPIGPTVLGSAQLLLLQPADDAASWLTTAAVAAVCLLTWLVRRERVTRDELT